MLFVFTYLGICLLLGMLIGATGLLIDRGLTRASGVYRSR